MHCFLNHPPQTSSFPPTGAPKPTCVCLLGMTRSVPRAAGFYLQYEKVEAILHTPHVCQLC